MVAGDVVAEVACGKGRDVELVDGTTEAYPPASVTRSAIRQGAYHGS